MDAPVVSIVIAIVVITLFLNVRLVPAQRIDVVERLGRYNRMLGPGVHMLVPYIDRVREKVDMREMWQTFPALPVVTSDDLVVSIETVLQYRAVDPVRVVYERLHPGIDQLTVTTLRDVIRTMDLEKALTSRVEISQHLSSVLYETADRWGINLTRVEINAIEPRPSTD